MRQNQNKTSQTQQTHLPIQKGNSPRYIKYPTGIKKISLSRNFKTFFLEVSLQWLPGAGEWHRRRSIIIGVKDCRIKVGWRSPWGHSESDPCRSMKSNTLVFQRASEIRGRGFREKDKKEKKGRGRRRKGEKWEEKER